MIPTNQIMMNPQYGYGAKASRPGGRHSCWRITVILVVFLIYLATIVFASLNAIPRDLLGGIADVFFEKSLIEEEFDPYPQPLNPPSWVFYVMWTTIFMWNLLWMFYGMSTICRMSFMGAYLYVDPPYMPMTLYICFGLMNGSAVGWIFLWDMSYTWISCIALAMCAFFGMVGLAVSMYNLNKYKGELKAAGKENEGKWVIGLVHNGLGMYTTWAAIATLLNFMVVLIYDLKVDPGTSSIIVLSILSLELLLWFILDNFVFWRATRFTFTPYIVVTVVCIAITIDKWGFSQDLDIFNGVLSSFAALFFLVKIVLTCVRNDSSDKRMSAYMKRPMTLAAPAPVMMKQSAPMMAQPMVQQAVVPANNVRYVQRPAIAAPAPLAVQTMPAQPMVQTVLTQPMAQTQEPFLFTQQAAPTATYYM